MHAIQSEMIFIPLWFFFQNSQMSRKETSSRSISIFATSLMVYSSIAIIAPNFASDRKLFVFRKSSRSSSVWKKREMRLPFSLHATWKGDFLPSQYFNVIFAILWQFMICQFNLQDFYFSPQKNYTEIPFKPAKIGLQKSVATLKCPRHCCSLVAVFVLLGFLLNPSFQVLAFLRERA